MEKSPRPGGPRPAQSKKTRQSRVFLQEKEEQNKEYMSRNGRNRTHIIGFGDRYFTIKLHPLKNPTPRGTLA